MLKHLDDLFLGPPARLALTRRYLTNQNTRKLAAHMIVADPRVEDSELLFELSQRMSYDDDYFDSQILTEQFADHAMVLSHRQYGVNTAEFRREDHFDFFGNEWEEWVPERVQREASILVFDEAPMPKPWVSWPAGMPDTLLPYCDFGGDTAKDIGCRNRNTWLELYNDYRRRRKVSGAVRGNLCMADSLFPGRLPHDGDCWWKVGPHKSRRGLSSMINLCVEPPIIDDLRSQTRPHQPIRAQMGW